VTRAALLTLCLAACAGAPRPTASVGRAAGHAPSSASPSCSHSPPVGCPATAPSFDAQVRPVLEQRCFGCHAGDGAAAEEHDFSTMERVWTARRAIADEVATCAMPPKAPLDDSEANTLLLWAACATGR
jgi:hypothetical protein